MGSSSLELPFVSDHLFCGGTRRVHALTCHILGKGLISGRKKESKLLAC